MLPAYGSHLQNACFAESRSKTAMRYLLWSKNAKRFANYKKKQNPQEALPFFVVLSEKLLFAGC
jgi:hypothetical protein